jgi:thiol:disulfide interchange protein DsbC
MAELYTHSMVKCANEIDSKQRSGMQQILKSLVCAVALTLGLSAHAAEKTEVPEEVASVILSKLKAARADFNFGAVRPSPIDGLYMVQIESGPIIFVSASGDFIVTGDLYGVMPGGFVDLLELAMQPERKAKLAAVPDSEQIIFPAKGERKEVLYIFTDVDCGYCRKQHQEVPALNAKGIEVRYLAYPRAGVGSPTYQTMAAAWCSKTPQETLTRIKSGLPIKDKYCANNPIAEQYRLGGELGVRGTPALILSDGQMLPGYTSATDLAVILGLEPATAKAR